MTMQVENDVSESETEEPVEDDEETEDEEDTEDEDESEDDDSAGEADESGDDDSDESTAEQPAAAAVGTVVAPTGKDLVDLLAGDEEAQRLVSISLEDMMAERARTAEAAAEAAEFQGLIDSGDYRTIGERIVQKAQMEQARATVSESVLKEQFTPVYTEIMAQPEMQKLTADEREALNPTKFRSDAHYVMALQDFITTKRANTAMEAEVQRRVKAITEGEKHVAAAAKTTKRSISGVMPASTGPVEDRRTSSELIKSGLRRIFEPDSIDEDEDT